MAKSTENNKNNSAKQKIIENILNIFFILTILNIWNLDLYLFSFISLILGIIFKKKGYTCKKNIVASILMTLFLIIQIFIIPAFDPEATEYQHVIDYGETINFKFPDTGECVFQKHNYDDYFNDGKYIYKWGYIYYNEVEGEEMLKAIKESDKWLESLNNDLIIYDLNYGSHNYDYFLIYNNTTKEYNKPLKGNKTINEIYFLAYDVEKRECSAAIYDIEG